MNAEHAALSAPLRRSSAALMALSLTAAIITPVGFSFSLLREMVAAYNS